MIKTIVKADVLNEYVKVRSFCVNDRGIEVKRLGGWESLSPDKKFALVDMIFTRPVHSKHVPNNNIKPGPGPADPDYYMGDGEYIKRTIINLEEYNWFKTNIFNKGKKPVVSEHNLELWRHVYPHIGNLVIHGIYNIGKLIGMAIDSDNASHPDSYYIIRAHRRDTSMIYDTMVGGVTALKGKIDNDDYERMEKIFDLNHPFDDSDINRKEFDGRVYTCIEDLYTNPCN